MPASKPRRARKDPELVRRLDEVRQLMKDRRTEAERRAAATMDAVQTYLHAAGVIRHSLMTRDHRIGELRGQIEQIEREYEAEATRWRAQQAQAVALMRDQGESDESIGQLLELTSRQVRQLMTAAARAADHATTDRSGPDRGGAASSSLETVRFEVQAGSQDAPTVVEALGQSLA
ncbi:hypothetical protein ACIO52_03055 [Nocardia sp. NPDC087230]|uniref:hypothetical protein n=1 Tax=Nocardia sp. NPDC087230 TaxID=3364331 RepID=UPI0037FCFE36